MLQDPACKRHFAHAIPIGLPRHAIDDATGAATAEDHGVRTLESFDAIDVVEIAEILDVVTYAVDEEIRGGAAATKNDGVAISFALRHAGARHVTRHVRETLHRLILDQRSRHDADRLRDVAQRSVRLGCSAAFRRPVRVRFDGLD